MSQPKRTAYRLLRYLLRRANCPIGGNETTKGELVIAPHNLEEIYQCGLSGSSSIRRRYDFAEDWRGGGSVTGPPHDCEEMDSTGKAQRKADWAEIDQSFNGII